MANVAIPKELLDKIATMETDALLNGLKDPEMIKNPAFLAKVRQFLKDNDILVSAKVEGMSEIVKSVKDIPNIMSQLQRDEEGELEEL